MNTIEFKSLITPSGVKFVQVTEDGVVRNSVPANDHVSIRLSKTASDGLFQILNSGDLGSYRFKRSQVTAPFSVNDDHLENILRDYFFCNGCTMYPPPPCNQLPVNWGYMKIRILNNGYIYGDATNDGCLEIVDTTQACFTACQPGNIAEMVCLSNVNNWDEFVASFVNFVTTSSGGIATANPTNYGTYVDYDIYLDMTTFDQATRDAFCSIGFQICTADCTAPTSCNAQFTIAVGNVIPPNQNTNDCNFTLSGNCADWITFPYQINPGDTNIAVALSIFNQVVATWGPLGYVITMPTPLQIRISLPCNEVPALWLADIGCRTFEPNNPASFALQITGNACNAGSTANLNLLNNGIMTVNQSGGNPQGQKISAIMLEPFTCGTACA